MRKPVVAVVAVLAVAAVGGVAVALVEHQHRGSLVAQSEQACDSRAEPVAGAPASLPLGLPATQGATLLDVTTQGATTVAFAKVPGTRQDIVAVRDRVLTDLAGAGYSTAGRDQEPGYEAEAELAGAHPGSVKVSPLCEGLLEIRYKIEQ